MKKKNNKTTPIVVVIIVVIAAAYFLTKSNDPEKYDDFAKCLTEKGISMGGTDWCPHCKEQKKRFGASFKYIDYHNCDNEKEWCISHGVRAYPTWVFPDGVTHTGTQKLGSLATLSGCVL